MAAGRRQATVFEMGRVVNKGGTERFARMRYVVTDLVPARIKVRPSNGLGAIHPDLAAQMHLRSAHASTCNRIMDNDVPTTYPEKTSTEALKI